MMIHNESAKAPGSKTPVSILLPAYNAAQYVEDAVVSTLRQTHREFELLLIDDGSTDGTSEILARLAATDSRIRLISQPNMGMGASLNAAAEEARYDWLVRMDADDVMPPNRLERQLAFLEAHPHVVLTSSLVKYIDRSGRFIGQNRSDYVCAANIARDLRSNELIGFPHPAVMIRRDAFRTVGGYRPCFWPCDDLDLWGRVLEHFPNGLLLQNEHLMHYRIHEGSTCVKSARRVYQCVEWVRECMIRRREGLPEPTWAQFTEKAHSAPFFQRLNNARREIARTIYKGGTLNYACRRFARAIPALLLAGSLEPAYVLRRLAMQVRGALKS